MSEHTDERTPWWRSDRFLDTIDRIFVKRRCGWCGNDVPRGEGHQELNSRYCSFKHAELYSETGAW